MDEHTREHLHETPAVVTVPLMALAVFSVITGWWFAEDVLSGSLFAESIFVLPAHDVLSRVAEEFDGPASFALHGLLSPAFWLAMAGVVVAWFLYVARPDIPATLASRFGILYRMLDRKYWFDEAYQFLFAGGARGIGGALWRLGDTVLIDGLFVNGTARTVGWFAGVVRGLQTGMLYHYAFAMIVGLLALLFFYVGG